MEKEVNVVNPAGKTQKQLEEEKEKKLILQEAKRKLAVNDSLKISVKEGSAASVMSGAGNSYITPYALALNANNAHIGFLSSLPSLIAPLAQLKGSRLIERYSRKKIVLTAILLEALMWIPITFLAFLFWKNIAIGFLPIALIIFFSLFAIFGAIAGPSWFSWMGDLVPENKRGRYFSNRNRITGGIALVVTLLAAFFLDLFKTKGFVLLGFAILFSIAMFARLISRQLFKKQYEPKIKLHKGYYFSLWQFIRKMPQNNFGKFVIYLSMIHFASAIAGPFFAVYMLKDLSFSYTTFMIVSMSATVASLAIMPLWGRFSDKFGNREALIITGIIIPIFPILWILSKSPIYLILGPQILGGAAWAGFNLAASNFIYDSVSPEKRGLCIAYFNVIIGIGIFIGATLGGFLAQYIKITNVFFLIFIISGVLRAAASLIMLPKIKEIRKVSKIKPSLVLKTLRPTQEIKHDFFWMKRLVGKQGKFLARGFRK